jgi:7-carboxy-7-deazaguanine synthase
LAITVSVDTLVISEVFGPTIQGEGPSTGRRAGFVRLGRCDLACSWCDTPYTWDWKGQNGVAYDPAKELSRRDVVDIAIAVQVMDVPLLVITGGEPLLQQEGLIALLERLHPRPWIEVETNGRHAPDPRLVAWVDTFNVSPKLPNSGQDITKTIRPLALASMVISGKAIFKFVCCSADDVLRVAKLIARLGIPASATWIMPEGKDPEGVTAHLPQVAEAAIGQGFNITGRLHVAIWGDHRGH